MTNLEEFDVVVKARLGGRKEGFRILYSGETDCIDAGSLFFSMISKFSEYVVRRRRMESEAT